MRAIGDAAGCNRVYKDQAESELTNTGGKHGHLDHFRLAGQGKPTMEMRKVPKE